MSRPLRHAVVVCAIATVLALSLSASAQRRGGPPPQAGPRQAPAPHQAPAPRTHVHSRVFIGGYFYDPFWGPYPWWPQSAYWGWYYPTYYDVQAEVHIKVQPEHAAVYVDGFYAGIVDDFNGYFHWLTLTPGGHTIAVYLDGYRTIRENLYLASGSSATIRHTMEKLPPGVASEPPMLSQPVPQPPEGSYEPPHTPSAASLPPPAAPQAVGYGTLELRIQPATATVTIDGQRWVSADHGVFIVQMMVGMHRVEVEQSGFHDYTADIEIRERQTTPLNVSLRTK